MKIDRFLFPLVLAIMKGGTNDFIENEQQFDLMFSIFFLALLF